MYDWLLVFLLLLVLSFLIQQYVQYMFYKWGKTNNSAQLPGLKVAEVIAREAGLSIQLVTTDRKLGDHYHPPSNTVCLSMLVAHEPSVAALAVTAHELGHAQQWKEGSGMIRLRDVLVPAVRFAPTVSYALLIIGSLFGSLSLIWAGIGFFALATLFILLTLPIEFDANRRALDLLERCKLMSETDRRGAREMLSATVLTYVVASALSVTQLMRFVMLRRRF